MTEQELLAACLVLPAAGALLVVSCHRWPNVREAVSFITAVAVFAALVRLAGPVLDGARPELVIGEMLPGVRIAVRLEPLGLLFAVIAAGLWFVSALYSIGYMRSNEEHHQTRFFACFALAIGSAIGVAFAGNLLTLYLFYEVLTLVTYPLVTHHGDDKARRGGRTYLGLLLLTSTLFLLPAIALTYAFTGTLDFVPGGTLGGVITDGVATLLLALYVFGIGKAAVMPVHRWLPAAMVAPTPVSALLHAVAVVKAGVFSIVKIVVYVFGTGAFTTAFVWLPWLAGFTIVAASIVAMRADNLKRRLAYSTISQLSYVVMSVALLAPLSVVGAIVHIAAHAFAKITLFFAAGAIYTAAHKTEVSQLDGIGWRMPWTFFAFAIGSLSMIGLPPAAGFVSKWYIISGSLQANEWMPIVVIVLSTLLNAAYLVPILYRAFFVAPRADDAPHGEAPWQMVAAMLVTSALTIAMFWWSDLPLKIAYEVGGHHG